MTASYFNDLSSSGDIATVKNTINGLSGKAYTNAISSLDNNSVANINKVGLKHNDIIREIVSQRLALSNYNTSNNLETTSNDTSYNFKNLLSNLNNLNGWWSRVYAGSTNKKTDTSIGNNGYDDDYYGLVIGKDVNTGRKTSGLILSLQEGNIQSDRDEGRTDYTSFSLTPYFSRLMSNLKLFLNKVISSFLSSLIKISNRLLALNR